MTNIATACLTFFLLCLPFCKATGQFEIELERFINPKGLNNNGTCCHGPNGFLTCLQPCRTFIRFCLRNVNANLDQLQPSYTKSTDECTYGFDETPIVGGNSIDFTRLTQQANRIVLPFKFSWMGDFVLQIDIFNDRTYDSQPYPGSQRDLILSTTIRSSIWPNSSWHHSQTIDSSLNSHQFSFRYRVSCSTHFYGSQCSRYCSPLSAHSRCDPQTGEILCEQGWTGVDCNQAVCRENCQHGHCTNQPGQCICHSGWMGSRCDQAIPNQTTESTKSSCPKCLNGGQCLGSTCRCPRGYRGVQCEERICYNGGLSSSGKCQCPPNYQGDQCQIELSCPICRNQGRCVNNKCVCTKDFIGQYCEINIQLLQKKSSSVLSMELLILMILIVLFLTVVIVLSCLFYRYASQRQKQLQQMKEINLEKIWTVENNSKNVFEEKTYDKDKLPETKDINTKLKQMDVHASLV